MKRDVQMYWGGVIRDLRINRGITQEKLAELSDLDPTHISMIERSLRFPTFKTLFSLADALGIPASKLVELVEERAGK